MSEFKGTPGPWVIDESRHDGCINRIAPFRHIGMASGYQVKPGDREENEANARLMASSPELLSIAKRWAALDAEWHPDRYANEKARLLQDTKEAIAKATE